MPAFPCLVDGIPSGVQVLMTEGSCCAALAVATLLLPLLRNLCVLLSAQLVPAGLPTSTACNCTAVCHCPVQLSSALQKPLYELPGKYHVLSGAFDDRCALSYCTVEYS